MAYTQDYVNQLVQEAAAQAGGSLSYSDTLHAATNLGIPEAQILNAISTGVITDYADYVRSADEASDIANIWDQQLGVDPSDMDYALSLAHLRAGGSLDSGSQFLNNTDIGYNYDTQDIVSAYRSTMGRNPTQEEYVSAMAQLGIQNFDQSTLGQSGQYLAATVAALESDPYAGRYAGYNPYNLPSDAANVSTNILGDQVQYISPITQRPVVSSFNDGNLELSAGDDVFTPEQVRAAIGLASATGALTENELQAMIQAIDNAKTADDFYAAFSKPQAVASLNPDGTQTGVGKTYEQALANGFNGVDMDAIYKALYKDAAPYKTSDIFTPAKLQPTITSLKNAMVNGFQTGGQLSGNSTPQTLMNLGTFGAAGDERMGSGNADYQSEMIKSLRDADAQLKSTNTGVTKYGYVGNGQGKAITPPTGDAAFNPGVIEQDAASPEYVDDWNAYGTYKINSLNAKSPYLTFDEWLAGGKSDGKPVEQPVTQYITD